MTAAIMWSMAILPIAVAAQTRIDTPKNKYKVEDDIKLGRDAAAEVEQKFPILNDNAAQNYVSQVGERLVRAIPAQYRHSQFDYTFKIVNASDINAFALPGGPMFVDRGMIEAAKNEGEMAGVMAHEISHVALRHATAQATETQKLQVGSILGQIAGAVIGGGLGQIIGAGSQIGFGVGALKYSRKYETQADILGARIMADAGYDPRDLANMFKTIAAQGGNGAPEWLSSHPDPGNRYEKINSEASLLRVSSNPIKLTREFSRTKERLSSLPAARTMAQIEKGSEGGQGSTQSPINGGRYSTRVAYPSTRTQSYNAGSISLNYPSNWKVFSGNDLIFAPEGAYGNQGITRGVMIGAFQTQSSLFNGTKEYVKSILDANDYLRNSGSYQRMTVAGRTGYTTTLIGRSPLTNRDERVTVYTAQAQNGNLLYIAAVSPNNESSRYSSTFRNLVRSIRLNDR